LPDNYVLSIGIAPDEAVFVGMRKGKLARFDGIKGVECPSAPDSVALYKSLRVDSQGKIWGTTSKGVYCYTGEEWVIYTTSDGLPDNRIFQLAISSEGVIWVTTYSGAARFENGRWSPIFKDNAPLMANALAIAPDGAVWFGSKDVYRYHDGSWETYPTSDFLSFSISIISFDDRGRPWIGAFSRELYFYDGERWVDRTPLSYYVLPANARGPEIIALEFGPDGSLWCGIPGPGSDVEDLFGGVYHLDRKYIYDFDNASWKKSLWTRYHMGYGLPKNSVMALAVAREGTVWAGTSYGLSKYTPITTEVEKENIAPGLFSILGNRPNPFNPSTSIFFALSEHRSVILSVYDITGRKVRELISGYRSAGEHSVLWDGRDDHGNSVSSGVYISRLESGGRVSAARMLLMK
jgi:streptogramin lyase